jgi:alkylation response protein AidB-like acyl-CoA dehydrogenase
VIKYLPLFPVCDGRASTVDQEVTEPSVVRYLPAFPVTLGTNPAAAVALADALAALIAAEAAEELAASADNAAASADAVASATFWITRAAALAASSVASPEPPGPR